MVRVRPKNLYKKKQSKFFNLTKQCGTKTINFIIIIINEKNSE